jgi:hypothetical protein
MTIDEKVEQRLVASGVDVESDEGAARFQQELEREIERERKRQWQQPPRPVERVKGIRI